MRSVRVKKHSTAAVITCVQGAASSGGQENEIIFRSANAVYQFRQRDTFEVVKL